MRSPCCVSHPNVLAATGTHAAIEEMLETVLCTVCVISNTQYVVKGK
jgi:hypothetical protein